MSNRTPSDVTPTRRGGLALALLLLAGLATARAQTVDGVRLDRLKDAVQTEISYVEAESFVGDDRLLAELEELRDEVGHLRVLWRSGAPVEERQCQHVEARLLAIRDEVRRADVQTGGRRASPAVPEIPLGAEFDVRVPRALVRDGATAQGFEAMTLADLLVEGRVVVPAGSVVRGTARRVEPVSSTDRRAGLVVTLRTITVGDRIYGLDMHIMQVHGPDGRTRAIASRDDGSTLVAAEGQAVELAAGSTLHVKAGAAIELTDEL